MDALQSGEAAEGRSARSDSPATIVPQVPSRTAVGRLTLREALATPLPALGLVDRFMLRTVALFARRQVRAIHGLEHVDPGRDPFILALNHSTRRESLFVPGLIMFHRGGRLVHIWADWVYRMIPGIGWLYRRAGTIVVTTKPARLRFLNRFKRFYQKPQPAIERARAHLFAGRSVGVFPEGGLSRDPRALRPGRMGMARLSLETGMPIVPVGIRFPDADLDRPIPEDAQMEVHIGAPLQPPAATDGKPSPAAVRKWHGTVMTEIARLAGKTWQPRATGNLRR